MKTTDKIIGHLEAAAQLRSEIAGQNLQGELEKLQQWQCQRLIASHQRLWKSPRFRPAMQFFVDELYGPKDFSQRDKDIASVVSKLSRALPEKAMTSLEAALQLNLLSLHLDYSMVNALAGRIVDRDSYAAAYRQVERRRQRELQLSFIEELGEDLAAVVQVKGISMLIKLARKPAELAGLLSLHEFLEGGYKAFRKLGDVHEFTDPVIATERELMVALFDQPDTNPLPQGM